MLPSWSVVMAAPIATCDAFPSILLFLADDVQVAQGRTRASVPFKMHTSPRARNLVAVVLVTCFRASVNVAVVGRTMCASRHPERSWNSVVLSQRWLCLQVPIPVQSQDDGVQAAMTSWIDPFELPIGEGEEASWRGCGEPQQCKRARVSETYVLACLARIWLCVCVGGLGALQCPGRRPGAFLGPAVYARLVLTLGPDQPKSSTEAACRRCGVVVAAGRLVGGRRATCPVPAMFAAPRSPLGLRSAAAELALSDRRAAGAGAEPMLAGLAVALRARPRRGPPRHVRALLSHVAHGGSARPPALQAPPAGLPRRAPDLLQGGRYDAALRWAPCGRLAPDPAIRPLAGALGCKGWPRRLPPPFSRRQVNCWWAARPPPA